MRIVEYLAVKKWSGIVYIYIYQGWPDLLFVRAACDKNKSLKSHTTKTTQSFH